MSAALSLVITEAGEAAMLAAAGTAAVVIAEAGFTAAEFVVAPTLTALPGEFKRVDTIAGEAVDDRTVHLVIRDSSTDAYTVRGIGLYLDDGTLFAVYGQAAAILGKAAVSTFHLAVDVKFLPGQAALVQLGNTNFLNPPATETTKGVAYLALLAAVLAGEEDDTIVTPLTLEGKLAAFVRSALLGQPDGVATLDATGKLSGGQRPIIDAIDVYPVHTEAEMLALAAATSGDFAVRVDTGYVFILQATPAATLANWIQLATPAPVTSVNGKVGAVVLTAADVGAPPVARSITGSGLLAGQGGNLSADRVLNLSGATPEEAVAALINNKVLTPESLSLILAMIAAKAAGAATVTGSGVLAGQGGALSTNPVFDLAAATGAELFAAMIGNKVVTPASFGDLPKSHTPYGHHALPGGLIIQWIKYRAVITAETSFNLTFPTTFTSSVFACALTPFNASFSTHRNLWMQLVGEPSVYGFTCQTQAEEDDDKRLDGFDVIFLGA